MDPNDNDPLLNVNDIAAAWGVHPRTVRRWIDTGRLPTVRAEGQFRIRVRRSVAESILGERATPSV